MLMGSSLRQSRKNQLSFSSAALSNEPLRRESDAQRFLRVGVIQLEGARITIGDRILRIAGEEQTQPRNAERPEHPTA